EGSTLKHLVAFLALVGILSTDATPVSSSAGSKNVFSHYTHHGIHGQEIGNSTTIVSHPEGRRLQKRGNICNPSPRGNRDDVELEEQPAVPVFECGPDIPSVAECEGMIRRHGQVTTKTSIFYTGLDGRVDVGEIVLWDNVVDIRWYDAQAEAIQLANPNLNPSASTGPFQDFQKRLSQAFGQAAQGTAYICMPDEEDANNVFRQEKAWGGWEYPALTRNQQVTRVLRLDPNKNNEPRQIWQPSDGPTPNEPRG
ncbi:MAG: hypothetical protein Q9183_005867, partial [Haloplaca sp. 2 TL-2023]